MRHVFCGAIVDAGPSQKTRVVPLEDATFAKFTGEPGRGCIAAIGFEPPEEPPRGEMIDLQNWYNYRKQHWLVLDEHRLVCPDLMQFVG